jgi:aspartate carbamoyltransferase catalytic subunit
MNIRKMGKNSLRGKDILRIEDVNRADFEYLLKSAKKMKKRIGPARYETLGIKVVGSLFFETSTRTRLSFDAAAARLGIRTIGFDGIDGTSMSKKGESFEDTIRMVAGYSDAIVLRHPEAGAAERAAAVSHVPIINAGDGANEHPTQTLVDLYAMSRTHGKIDGLKVAMVGDLKYGRVPHSLAKALTVFDDVEQYWVAPDELPMPDSVREYVASRGGVIHDAKKIEEVIEEVDILYMTRVQVDRFKDMNAYEKIKDVYVLTPEMVKRGKDGMRILHALPRRYEIPEEIDALPQAYYFQQAQGGVPIRMALLRAILGS